MPNKEPVSLLPDKGKRFFSDMAGYSIRLLHFFTALLLCLCDFAMMQYFIYNISNCVLNTLQSRGNEWTENCSSFYTIKNMICYIVVVGSC